MNDPMEIMIISDGKPGHVNQARSLCAIMGWHGREAVAEYPSRAAKSATYLLDWLGLHTGSPFDLKPADGQPTPGDPAAWSRTFSLVVAVGSAAYYPAKVCARIAGLPVIALMHPKGFRLDFDHILCPFYDNPPRRPQITPLPITLCTKEQAFYQAATDEFSRKFAYRLPAVSVIIGGDNKYERMCPQKIQTELEQIFTLTPDRQHYVTTSRRTSPAVEAVVEQFPFDYKLIYSKEQYNPIPAFLNVSDYLFVTSDSASMISESVSMGTSKVEILRNIAKKPSKFDRFLTGLQDAGAIHLFDGTLGCADKKIPVEPLVRRALAHIVPAPESRGTPL